MGVPLRKCQKYTDRVALIEIGCLFLADQVFEPEFAPAQVTGCVPSAMLTTLHAVHPASNAMHPGSALMRVFFINSWAAGSSATVHAFACIQTLCMKLIGSSSYCLLPGIGSSLVQIGNAFSDTIPCLFLACPELSRRL